MALTRPAGLPPIVMSKKVYGRPVCSVLIVEEVAVLRMAEGAREVYIGQAPVEYWRISGTGVRLFFAEISYINLEKVHVDAYIAAKMWDASLATLLPAASPNVMDRAPS